MNSFLFASAIPLKYNSVAEPKSESCPLSPSPTKIKKKKTGISFCDELTVNVVED
jgi:hypothetical protein